MDESDKIKTNDWRTRGFNKFLEREQGKSPDGYLGGADFDIRLDDLLFNRMIRFRDVRVQPQGNDPGKVYWEGDGKKAKMWIDSIGKWADLVYTTTSTSTTSSSSSSSSTSSTSSSSSSSTSTTSSSSSSSSSTSTI